MKLHSRHKPAGVCQRGDFAGKTKLIYLAKPNPA